MFKNKLININPLEHPIILKMPRRDLSSTWMEHVPFAFYLMDLLRPRVLVELGTFYGVSYCAFCQAVAELKLPTICHAVDTWGGDAHTGAYDSDVLESLRQHHDPLYSQFSTLIQSTFEAAVGKFEDRTIDLLHIDGYHTYEAVKHDFEIWKLKLSRRGVVIFHDTNEHGGDFGVWQFMDELKTQYPCFEFMHGHGLGVVAVGEDIPEDLLPLLNATELETRLIRDFFYELGQRIALSVALTEKNEVEENLRSELQAKNIQLEGMQRMPLFRILKLIKNILKPIFPSGSHQRKTLDAGIQSMHALKNAGIKAIKTLQQAITTWKNYGLFILLRNTRLAAARQFAIFIYNRKSRLIDRKSAEKIQSDFSYRPLISIIIPTYNTPVRYLQAAIKSVQTQYYPYWELCICDDHSTNIPTVDWLKSITDDHRIKVIFSEKNGGIALATNKAVELSTGEFVAFLDHDDELTPDALFEMARLLNRDQDLDVIYSDQDKINPKGKRSEPFLKPDWSPEYFRSVMYIGHLLLMRRELYQQLGGSDSMFDGVQDYELMLRASERTSKIAHLPKILYHWRMIPGSVALGTDEKGEKIERLQTQAVNAHLKRLGWKAEATQHPIHHHRVLIKPRYRTEYPKVSIIILSRNAHKHIARCLHSIFERTTYPNYEVIVVDNGTTDPLALRVLREQPVRVVSFNQPFNYSQANNLGVEAAKGDMIVLLNNDTEVITPNWLEQMLLYFDFQDVAIVGPMLIYPNHTIQHAGIVLGLRGTADHIMRGYPIDSDGYAGSLSCPRNVSAVTGACLMMRKKEYMSTGGMLEYYGTHYQDVDLCLRFLSINKRIVYVPQAVLIHYEGATRGQDYDHLDRALLLDTWGELIARGDPFYNPNFSLVSSDYMVI